VRDHIAPRRYSAGVLRPEEAQEWSRGRSPPKTVQPMGDRPHSVPPRSGRRSRCVLYCLPAQFLSSSVLASSDFASSVLDFTPAPGQFINNSIFNDPARALGPPVGGGTLAADNSKLVSLGGFAGSITLAFDHTVLDDPSNRFGIDAIVFGNAIWSSGNPRRRWAEAGIIEIALDANSNGLADDPWYPIRAPGLPPIPASALQSQLWDNNAGTPTPPANIAWYPSPVHYPGWPPSYITTAFRLPPIYEVNLLINPNGPAATLEAHWGLADLSPTLILGDLDADNLVDDPELTPAEFYTRPDNPFLVGITAESGGGDGFDIAWAVDPVSGAPAELPGFDFIRISTGVNFIAGILGELSTEVGGVADARPDESAFDLNADGRIDIEDLYTWHDLRDASDPAADLTGEGVIDDADRLMMTRCTRRDEVHDVH